ncbi:MAG: trans-splicing intein-formed DNA polymerase III subunit alpha C-terminal partner DnaE-C [Oscillatoriales cyanobacterium SM2_2_1]|nr:trans-splicing intein-formed DNA polymerase III subunit alpha C-terminal partner DnaE-C [Oscillatoriales cyanobacterium SM2_2_1]
MRIVGKRSLGSHPVFDLGLSTIHNYLLASGLIASNCFNKSHSVAYGYVTYQTAYLKANYPVEYMAALLSSVSDDQSKIQRYIASCRGLGIEVLPPDINRSDIEFTPTGDRILFGLAAIKNLGMGVIEAILVSRAEDGAFQSLGDLCRRVDSRVLNRKGLEALIQTGALDGLEPNRRQLMQDLDLILEWASRRAREQASGQFSLFDVGGSAASTTEEFALPPRGEPVEDYAPQEKLRLEKELLGFYVSDHPLRNLGRAAKLMAPVNLADLDESWESKTVTAIAMVLEVKEIVTKKGDRMAIVQLEDLTGNIEAIAFPKSYERVRSHLRLDQRVMVWGKVDRKDEQCQLVIDDVQPIEIVRMIRVDLDREQALDLQKLHHLRQVLQSQTSEHERERKIPIVAAFTDMQPWRFIRLGNQFWVNNDQQAVFALQQAGFRATCDRLTP